MSPSEVDEAEVGPSADSPKVNRDGIGEGSAGLTPEEVAKLRFRWADLPEVSRDVPGTGGSVRHLPEDFIVTERPLYLPDGNGSHAYALVEKRSLTTRDLVVALQQAGLEEKQIGVAGLKDKHALTRQWLSVPNRFAAALEALDEVAGVRVLETSRHKNKLGIGHLLGNHFRVRVRDASPVAPDAAERARRALKRLQESGVPNYFGPQRFGRFGNNAVDGLKLVRGGWVPGGHRLKRFFVSALQSQLFNYGLKLRLERGLYGRVLAGDWAKKHDTGGVFRVEDEEVENARAARLEISATQPLYGKKVRVSGGEAGALEEEVLAHFGLRWLDFRSRKGSRRITRVTLSEVEVEPTEDGYWVSFFLPKGSFATNVLREVMKVEVDEPVSNRDAEE